MTAWQERFQSEKEAALSARQSGNEGKARVCARRALGVLAAAWLTDKGVTVPENAIECIRLLGDLPQTDAAVREMAASFLERVDTQKSLPSGVDLLVLLESLQERLSPQG